MTLYIVKTVLRDHRFTIDMIDVCRCVTLTKTHFDKMMVSMRSRLKKRRLSYSAEAEGAVEVRNSFARTAASKLTHTELRVS